MTTVIIFLCAYSAGRIHGWYRGWLAGREDGTLRVWHAEQYAGRKIEELSSQLENAACMLVRARQAVTHAADERDRAEIRERYLRIREANLGRGLN